MALFPQPVLASSAASSGDIPLWLVGPFVLLLLLIAVMPLSPARIKHFWERFYAHISVGLGFCVAAYFLLILPHGGPRVLSTVEEYASFICLIGSLFVVAGGIHIKVKGEATPAGNVVFLAIGAVIANLVGTTGASMVLIRPFIRMNKVRITAYHIVFFIFVVSNCGGALTPIGDPPLFLGYLRGVPFFWLAEHAVLPWLFTNALILGAFFLYDRVHYARLPGKVRSMVEQDDTWKFEGGINVLLLGVIIGAVFITDRFFLREIVMLCAAAVSYRFTGKQVHEDNHFSFGPIKEVAFLFAGIFLTMMPALGYLQNHGKELGFVKPAQYYFASGSLSSVLDNAPTYLNFLELAQATFVDPTKIDKNLSDEDKQRAGTLQMIQGFNTSRFIIAVSLGSVFFGAMTYIGNGPNFMVKSIADSAGVKTPTFFGYVFKYSLPVLLPILALCGWLFV